MAKFSIRLADDTRVPTPAVAFVHEVGGKVFRFAIHGRCPVTVSHFASGMSCGPSLYAADLKAIKTPGMTRADLGIAMLDKLERRVGRARMLMVLENAEAKS